MMTLRLLEEFSLNALPALHTLHYDGWVLRFSNGYPRRANSIQLLYPSLLPLDEKIDYCESQYTARGIKTVYKMTPAAPDGLDAALRARGYVQDAESSVRTLDLAGFAPVPPPDAEVLVEPRMSDGWAEDFARLNDEEPVRAGIIRLLLERLSIESAFVRLRVGGETVALGRGALDNGWVGFYEIATAPAFRQQGWGTHLMQTIIGWGIEHGAQQAYLQVMTRNAPALRLYSKLGFHEQYRYWYLQTPAS